MNKEKGREHNRGKGEPVTFTEVEWQCWRRFVIQQDGVEICICEQVIRKGM
jgi:hypothetical protein